MPEVTLYVFNGQDAPFPTGIFSRKELALEWIEKYSLTGVLTVYPMDVGVYDWAINKGFFTPKKEYQNKAAFIQKFTTASMEHYHFINGEPDY